MDEKPIRYKAFTARKSFTASNFQGLCQHLSRLRQDVSIWRQTCEAGAILLMGSWSWCIGYFCKFWSKYICPEERWDQLIHILIGSPLWYVGCLMAELWAALFLKFPPHDNKARFSCNRALPNRNDDMMAVQELSAFPQLSGEIYTWVTVRCRSGSIALASDSSEIVYRYPWVECSSTKIDYLVKVRWLTHVTFHFRFRHDTARSLIAAKGRSSTKVKETQLLYSWQLGLFHSKLNCRSRYLYNTYCRVIYSQNRRLALPCGNIEGSWALAQLGIVLFRSPSQLSSLTKLSTKISLGRCLPMFDLVHHNFERMLTSASISRNIAKCENMERVVRTTNWFLWRTLASCPILSWETPTANIVSNGKGNCTIGVQISARKPWLRWDPVWHFETFIRAPPRYYTHCRQMHWISSTFWLRIRAWTLTVRFDMIIYAYCHRRPQRFDSYGIVYKSVSIYHLGISPTCDIKLESLEKFCRQVHWKTWQSRQPFGLHGRWIRTIHHFSLSTRVHEK